MAQYRLSGGNHGDTYARLLDGEWVSISEEEARSAGVWQDPRGGQYFVRDELATPEQLQARKAGMYDPRESSGPFVALRVKLLCVRCGTHLGNVAEYEARLLFHSLRMNQWTRRPQGLKCEACFKSLEGFPVDLDAVKAAVEVARRAGRAKSLKIGSKPANLL